MDFDPIISGSGSLQPRVRELSGMQKALFLYPAGNSRGWSGDAGEGISLRIFGEQRQRLEGMKSPKPLFFVQIKRGQV